MELVLGPGPTLPPSFSFLLLLGLLFIGIWSILPGDLRQKLLSAKIRETLRQQNVPENHKATRVPPPHWEDTLQMECTGADLACFSGLPVGWAQNYTHWSMDKNLQHIFHYLKTTRSSLMNLSLSSQATSTPSSSSSTTGSQDLKTPTFYECLSPGFSRHQRTSLHSNLGATQSISYNFRDRLQHRSHSLPNLSKNYSKQARHSLLPFLLSQGNDDITEKNIFLDKCACNYNHEQRFCKTKTSEEENAYWPPKETRNFLEFHIRNKFAQHLPNPSIIRTINPSISPYPLAYNVIQEMKTIKKMEGNRVLKVSNPSSSNLQERPWLPCWAPIKLSRSAWWVLEGHMAWKVYTLRAQRVPRAVKQSWAMLNHVNEVENEDPKPGSSKIQTPVSFPQNTVKGTNKKSLLPMDLESERIISTTPKLSKEESQSQSSLDASFSGVDVSSGEVTFLQEDVKKKLELCIQKKVNCLLKKAMRQKKEALKEDEKSSTRLKLQVTDSMKLLQTVSSDSGFHVQVTDSEELTEESRGQVTDSLDLNSGSQIQELLIQGIDELELILVSQKQDVDSLELKVSSSKVQDTDSGATTPVPEEYDVDSMELTPGSSVQDVDSMGPTPGLLIKNVDSGGLNPESQVKLTDFKEMIQGSQVKPTDSKGPILGSQFKLTDSKGLILGSQVKFIDSKEMTQVSQAKPTDSKGLTPGSEVKRIDSKRLTQGSQIKLKDSKELTLKPQVQITDSVEKTPWPCIQVADSVGLTSESKIQVIDPKQCTLELQPAFGDFHLIQGSTPPYILGSDRIAAKLKPGLHGSKTQEILRSMLRDLNENIVLQKPFISRMSSKFSKTAQPSTLPKSTSVQSSHSLHQWRESCRYLFQAPLFPSWRSKNSYCQEGQRPPRALKWPVSGRQVKTLEKQILKGRVARRKTTISMLRKNLWAKKQQAHHIQEAQVQRSPQGPFPYAPSWHFVPPRQTMVSQSWQRMITESPFRTPLSVNYSQRDRLGQLFRKNLPVNEQVENSKPRASQDYPDLTTKEAQSSSEPTEGRKEREQVPLELNELRQSRGSQLPSSHKPPSTEENTNSVKQNEKPDIRSQIRTSEPQHKPLSVTSSHEQNELLRELQQKITQQLLKNQLSPHFTPSQNTGMVLQYPMCLQCGRCSGPSCPHKFHDSVGPWLLVYPQLRLFRNSEGREEFRVKLGFRLRTRTETPKKRRKIGPLVSMRHTSSQSDPTEKRRKSKVCTCHVTKKNLTVSPSPKIDLGPEPFQPPEPSQTPEPIQVHIIRNLPGRRVEVLKANSEHTEQYDFKMVHSFLHPDIEGGWARNEAKLVLDSEQMKTPKEIRTQKTESVRRQSIPKDQGTHPERENIEAQKAATSNKHSEEPTEFMHWFLKRALGMAYSPIASFQQRYFSRARPSRQQSSVFPEPPGFKKERKLSGEFLNTTGLDTEMEKKSEREGKDTETFKSLRRSPKSIDISQTASFLKLTPKSSSTSPVLKNNISRSASHSK